MSMYAPRQFTFQRVVPISDAQFKAYTITTHGREACSFDTVAAHAAVVFDASVMPTLEHAGLGYIIYHAGEDANWLLVRAWLSGGIVSGLMHKIEDDQQVPVKDPLIECVWEEVVSHHERNAWVQYMMQDNDTAGYLGDTLPDGQY